MRIPIYQIDAFTNEQFRGNSAAICPLTEWINDDLMQKIAAENNLSETAFFVKTDDEYELRWFTPKGEVDLCGHATLAAAYVICTYLDENLKSITFRTKSGLLGVSKDSGLFTLSFPSREGEKCETPEALIKGLGKVPKEVYRSRDYMAVFDTEQDLLDLELNMDELKKLDGFGVIATAKGNEVDFVSRFFAPKAGIDEDPVTGSAHCTLIPYWKSTLNKNELVALQLSERGGKLYCTDLGGTVKMSGEAVSYLEGYINV
ncbi:PhzF family phenazine biosynthesis protein [Alkalihalophilus lindianensis]|uniref:PhzF family phenazine biosynthesis protein n=1 Tax=Alkalihalophilus lindianensis TaxID=1630542 RepID=A0ABU3XCQ0_9BACI|nr:PhzF family phenazine biosynthesis protein [Alkalihalophilus lindianensis]MDV2685650.1 PhzF family phenazine biosynthesis protein [Alkalihalophilus lindianensis]